MDRVADIGIGIVGGGYMGKAHAVAMAAVASIFDTSPRPRLKMASTTTPDGAAGKTHQFGFARAAADSSAQPGGWTDARPPSLRSD